jgi:protoporphyrinogen oxidase
MNIAIIGAGWAGVYTAYELKKINPNFKISIFERESKIGGKCKVLNRDLPGGAIQFPHYKFVGKVFDEFKINMTSRFRFHEKDLKRKFIFSIAIKLLLNFNSESLVSDVFNDEELKRLDLIIKNYGYRSMTMHYFYIYLNNFLSLRIIFEILNDNIVKHFLPTTINHVMEDMLNCIETHLDTDIVKIAKVYDKYVLYSKKETFSHFDKIIFTIPTLSSYNNIVPKEIVDECNKLTYTKYASVFISKERYEKTKDRFLFAVDIEDKPGYLLAYTYDIDTLKDISEDAKNIVNNYFPFFENPKASKNKIESFQGKDDLFYTGGYLSFELTESISEHIQNKILCHFRESK